MITCLTGFVGERGKGEKGVTRKAGARRVYETKGHLYC